MKNTKVKNIIGYSKNIILISSVILSLLILFSESIIYNYIITFLFKLACLLNIYCFIVANTEKWLND